MSTLTWKATCKCIKLLIWTMRCTKYDERLYVIWVLQFVLSGQLINMAGWSHTASALDVQFYKVFLLQILSKGGLRVLMMNGCRKLSTTAIFVKGLWSWSRESSIYELMSESLCRWSCTWRSWIERDREDSGVLEVDHANCHFSQRTVVCWEIVRDSEPCTAVPAIKGNTLWEYKDK